MQHLAGDAGGSFWHDCSPGLHALCRPVLADDQHVLAFGNIYPVLFLLALAGKIGIELAAQVVDVHAYDGVLAHIKVGLPPQHIHRDADFLGRGAGYGVVRQIIQDSGMVRERPSSPLLTMRSQIRLSSSGSTTALPRY